MARNIWEKAQEVIAELQREMDLAKERFAPSFRINEGITRLLDQASELASTGKSKQAIKVAESAFDGLQRCQRGFFAKSEIHFEAMVEGKHFSSHQLQRVGQEIDRIREHRQIPDFDLDSAGNLYKFCQLTIWRAMEFNQILAERDLEVRLDKERQQVEAEVLASTRRVDRVASRRESANARREREASRVANNFGRLQRKQQEAVAKVLGNLTGEPSSVAV